jgi:mono/diheme cytochrome c family protein
MHRIIIVLVLSLLVISCSNDADDDNNGPTLEPTAAAGRQVFRTHCASCHAINGDRVVVGPSLDGLASRADGRVEDLDAEAYIYQSITAPNAYIVDGFTSGAMPQNFAVDLTSDEVNQLVTYLLTLE